MRLVIQRVTKASITINNIEERKINKGLVVLVGIEERDTSEDIDFLCKKIINLRIFDDANGVMNDSVLDVSGDIMLVSQFTLQASTKKGNRPSYIKAAKPEISIPLYEELIDKLNNALSRPIVTGEFGADMQINLINDGPVTIWIDSHNKE
ncbi:MAG: D-tyrosyl-tRNA(Tyr) deacylase [Proteiniphilum sp.]|nr:D-tyrosyl-tRNA(Tyr) deacylase [Proteiniphilum sp.]